MASGRLEDVPHLFMETWNRHDMPAFAALFAEDADFVNVVGIWWRSRPEIEAAHAETHATIFKGTRLDGEIAATTYLAPDIAAAHVSWELNGLRLPDGAAEGSRRGILLLILTRGTEGWTIKVAQNTDVVPDVLAPPATA